MTAKDFSIAMGAKPSFKLKFIVPNRSTKQLVSKWFDMLESMWTAKLIYIY